MIRQLLTYGNTFCAVEHTVDHNSFDIFYVLQLKKIKKELTISSKNQFSSKSELFPHLKTQKHLFLIINNQHVLLKKVDTITDKENVVKTAFPNIKISDFYYEISKNNGQSFVAICRKTYIDNLLAEYQSKGSTVIGFSLQNLALTSLIPFLKQSEIETSNSEISFSDKMIHEIKKNDFDAIEYTINDLKISNKHVLSLSGILSYFYNSTHNKSNFSSVEKELKIQYNNHRFNTAGLKTALGIIFAVLLVNFLFFSTAYSKMNSLTGDVILNSSSKNTLLQLQGRVEQKMELTKSINSLSSSKTSWYLNELGKSVPNKLQLSVIDFQPLAKSIKKDKEITVVEDEILVKGTSKSNDSFSGWVAELELKSWIDNVVIISYGKGKKTTATFEFVVHIKS